MTAPNPVRRAHQPAANTKPIEEINEQHEQEIWRIPVGRLLLVTNAALAGRSVLRLRLRRERLDYKDKSTYIFHGIHARRCTQLSLLL